MKMGHDWDFSAVPEPDSTREGGRGEPLPPLRPLIDFGETPPDPAATLLGNRFLCRESGMLFVGPSGIGKTSASVQQDLLWSVGLPAFGIAPARPLKILTIQAEDDDGDLSEIVSSVKSGLHFTMDQIQESRERCFYIAERSRTGDLFLQFVVKPLLELHRPDLLRINPLQAYLGGEIKDTSITAGFLRNGLNPFLTQFQCGCIIVHHTPKTTFTSTKDWKASDWMYAGAGSADITNWSRAALVIDSTDNPRVFRFIAAKRGSRIGWLDDLTGKRERIRHFAHEDNGSIFWREALEDEVKQAGKAHKQAKDLLTLVPQEGSVAKAVLLSRLPEIGIGQVKGKGFLAELISEGAAFEWLVPRPRTNPEVRIARYEQPVPPAA
jgi:AAA domain-containing protein